MVIHPCMLFAHLANGVVFCTTILAKYLLFREKFWSFPEKILIERRLNIWSGFSLTILDGSYTRQHRWHLCIFFWAASMCRLILLIKFLKIHSILPSQRHVASLIFAAIMKPTLLERCWYLIYFPFPLALTCFQTLPAQLILDYFFVQYLPSQVAVASILNACAQSGISTNSQEDWLRRIKKKVGMEYNRDILLCLQRLEFVQLAATGQKSHNISVPQTIITTKKKEIEQRTPSPTGVVDTAVAPKAINDR